MQKMRTLAPNVMPFSALMIHRMHTRKLRKGRPLGESRLMHRIYSAVFPLSVSLFLPSCAVGSGADTAAALQEQSVAQSSWAANIDRFVLPLTIS